jgi:hypothetical protein
VKIDNVYTLTGMAVLGQSRISTLALIAVLRLFDDRKSCPNLRFEDMKRILALDRMRDLMGRCGQRRGLNNEIFG